MITKYPQAFVQIIFVYFFNLSNELCAKASNLSEISDFESPDMENRSRVYRMSMNEFI